MQSFRRLSVPLAALVLALATVLFRLPTLGSLSNDHYLYMAWAQQVLSGELPGRDFVDPGMPLAYSLSALVQYARPGPFSEGVFSILLLALAAGATCLVVTRLSQSLAAGVLAALFQIALQPRLYSYPKVLVPAVALWLLQRYIAGPSRGRLAAMAAWTVAGALLRYDLGLYAAAGLGIGIAIAHWGEARRMAMAVGSYVLALGLVLLPYVAFVEWREGVAAHLHETVEYTRNETHALDFPWPTFPALEANASAAWSPDDSAAFLFYVAYGLAVTPWLLLLATRRRQRRDTTAVVAAAGVMLAAYLVVILRYPIETRIQDLAGVMTLTGAWTVVELLRLARSGAARGGLAPIGGAVATAVLAATVTLGAGASVWVLGKVGEQLEETRVLDGWGKVQERIGVIRDAGTVWPWDRFWPAGPLPAAVRYLNACTQPGDRVLLTWSAPEYYYFSRRAFAGGHAIPLPPRAFTGSADQNLMLRRLARASVPIVLINETRQEQFKTAYPQIAAYLQAQYVPGGQFTVRDGSNITIARRKGLAPARSFEDTGWPCFTP
ncbi:MAG: hypothetical protein HY824_15895 [Acidobacteria bacterium]|nr:hypothetical protein [Acidobacteriota bacterium]